MSRSSATAFLFIVGVLAFTLQPSVLALTSTTENGTLVPNGFMTNTTMRSAVDVQAFLERYNGGCTASQYCLRTYTENGKTTADTIYTHATAASISSEALLVMIQTQAMLVTDTNPSLTALRSGLYGCDNADEAYCEANQYGFTNQVKLAAAKLSDLLHNPQSTYALYHLGDNTIPFSPITTCGSSTVPITNQDTVAIYSYATNLQYQPDQAAINAGTGKSSSDCSSYGARNYSNYANTWFINPVQSQPVYRLTNYITGERVFTTSFIEVMIAEQRYPGWKYEGVSFSTALSDDGRAQPVYRMTNYYLKARLFTTSKFEVDYALSHYPGWIYEGEVFKAYSVQISGSVPIYRLTNKLYGSRLFTASKVEADYAVAHYPGWVYEGPIAFYAIP